MTLPLLGAGKYAAAAAGLVNSEATAFIARMTSAPNSTRQNLIDAFFTAIKAIGLAKFDAVYLFAAHDSQSSLLNLVSTSYNCTAENAPTFTADRGYNGVGADGRLNTGFNPSTAAGRVHLQDNGHVSGWSLTATGLAAALWGQVSSANLSMYPRWTDNLAYYRHHTTSDDQNVSSDATGHWLSSRSAAAGFTVYRNGASLVAETRTSTAPNSSNIIYLDNSGESAWTGRVACGSIGGNLTSGEVTSLYNAFLAYLQGVGAV